MVSLFNGERISTTRLFVFDRIHELDGLTDGQTDTA